MREFVKGWRRKAGCLTLVMACVFAAGWLRSWTVSDRLSCDLGSTELRLLSISNHLVINPQMGFSSFSLPKSECEHYCIESIQDLYGERFVWEFQFHGFAAKDATIERFYMVPFWSIVVPLTMLCLAAVEQTATREES